MARSSPQRPGGARIGAHRLESRRQRRRAYNLGYLADDTHAAASGRSARVRRRAPGRRLLSRLHPTASRHPPQSILVFFKATKNTKGTNRAKVPVGERRDHQPDWQPPGQAVRGSVARSSSQGQVALGRTTADREDVTLYTLRHSHASALHPAGFTLPEAARRLGHAVAEHAGRLRARDRQPQRRTVRRHRRADRCLAPRAGVPLTFPSESGALMTLPGATPETDGRRLSAQALHRTRTDDPFLTMEVLYQLS